MTFEVGQVWRHPTTGLLIRVERVDAEGPYLWCSYPGESGRRGQPPALRRYRKHGFELIHALVPSEQAPA